jgi:hypothetical protein
MAILEKIDSNITGLRWAEEESVKNLPNSGVVWNPLEPNKYSDFGGALKTLARTPINPSRQRKKGVTVDLDSSGGFNTDLTQANLQELLQGFFFADLRRKAEFDVATVEGSTDDDYVVAANGTDMNAGDLLFAKKFADGANNGLKIVDAGGDGTHVPVTTNLTAAATQTGVISRVGHQFAAGDAKIDDSTYDFPALTTVNPTGFDMTKLGINPGEWVYIGDDSDPTFSFATDLGDNGWKRVRSVTSFVMQFDKSVGTMVTNNGGSQTIRLFCGRVLKNETGELIVRRSYQLERTLGSPDTSDSAQQAEYVTGAIPNEMTLNMATADKLNVDLSFVGMDVEQNDQDTDVKTGDRPDIEEASAFNTSTDVVRAKLGIVGDTDPLFAFLQELKITLKNNVKPNKAVGIIGAFEASAGTFDIGGSMTAYFADVASAAAIRANEDITLDLIFVKENAGIAIDIPLLTLGDGRPNVEANSAITLPLSMEAGTGAKVDATLDHTMMMVFFDYLPDAAAA